MKFLLVSGMALAAALPAQAQTASPTDAADQPDAAAPHEIVVTGRGLDQPPGAAAYDSVTISRDRLTSAASGRLDDVLRDVAGIAQYRRSDSRSAHPTSQGVTLRGLGGNASSRALLTLDGVPQADPFGGWVAFPAYLPERLAEVRVTRGGGSGYAGPGALAGTIEMTSATPEELGHLQVAGRYGSRDSVDATVVGGAELGRGFFTIATEYARGDGFTPIIAEDRGPVDRRAPYEQASVALRGVVPVGETTELQANLSGFTDRRDRGVEYTDIKSEGADVSVRLVGHGAWGWSALGYVQSRTFASGFASVNDARTTATATLNQVDVPSTGVGGRIEFQPPIGSGATLRFGADVRRVEGQTEELYTFVSGSPTRHREAGGASLTAGGFADLSVERGRWTFDASGRVDHWSISDGHLREVPLAGGAVLTDTRYADRDGWETTGRVGAAFGVTRQLKLRAAAYRGWRLPTLNELYRPYRVGADAIAANAALRPERLIGIEGGVDLGQGPFTARATVFWNRLDDAIANVTLATTPGTYPGVGYVSGSYLQRQNLDAVESRGAELDLAWRHGPLSVSASYAYTDARVHADGAAAQLDGLRPAQTAPHLASATVAWRRADGLGAALTGRYSGAQYEDDLNTTWLRDAFTLDGSVAVPVSRRLSVEGRAENLFDARVDAGNNDGVVERATPRTLWIGFRYRLG